jgi:hypothetical protein
MAWSPADWTRAFGLALAIVVAGVLVALLLQRTTAPLTVPPEDLFLLRCTQQVRPGLDAIWFLCHQVEEK